MNLRLTPCLLRGTVTPPPSKSYSHRALIAAALAGEGSRLENLAESRDIDATRRCLKPLLEPGDDLPLLDCGESGSTLRFLIPPALVLRGGARLTGRGRLMERPLEPYFQLFREKNIACSLQDHVLTVRGQLTPGTYSLRGDISSQFFTGLLFALPLLDGESVLTPSTPLESGAYVDMTIKVLEQFGIRTGACGEGWCIPGPQRYRPGTLTVEADWSQGSFFLFAKFLGSPVSVTGLDPDSAQPDRRAEQFIRQLEQPGDLELDVSQCPDLVPPLALGCALRPGTVQLVNAARLRMKESDRLNTVAEVLNALGARVEEFPDSLLIRGVTSLAGGVTVDCRNDHRIAMMAAVAATRCESPVTLLGTECVEKSYPSFWQDYAALGGQIEEV